MSDGEYLLSYEDRLQFALNASGLSLDDVVLSNGKLSLTSRALLTSYTETKDRDRILYTLSYNIAKGCNTKDCVVALLKVAAQEGKLKLTG